MHTSNQEALWVLRAQCDDREALELLLRSVQPAVHRYLCGLVGPADADDVLQEILVQVYRQLGWLETPKLFRPWVFRIASRAGFRHLKSRNPVGEQRAEVIETGLQALDMAMAARRDSPAAPYLKAQLLREKVELTMDPAERQALRDEIGDLEKLLADLEAAGQAPKKPQQ